MSLRVLDIVSGTIVDGPGLRTSVYFAGCPHHCHGCHNPDSWHPSGGREMSEDELLGVIAENGLDVTFSGGDPLFQPEAVAHLARRIREEQGRGVWCYTGYTYEAVLANPRLSPVLDYIDVLVDGPFIEALRDTALHFRGSRNQRLVDVSKSSGTCVVEWSDNLLPF